MKTTEETIKDLEARREEFEAKAKIEAEMRDEVLVAKIQVEINARKAIIAFSRELLEALKQFDGKVMNKKISEDLMNTFTMYGEPRGEDNHKPLLRSVYMRAYSYRYADFDEGLTTYKQTHKVVPQVLPNVSIKCRKFDRVWDNDKKMFNEEIVPLWIGADDVLRNYEFPIYTTVIGSTDRYSHYATEKKINEQMEREQAIIKSLEPFTDIKELKRVKEEHEKLKKTFRAYHDAQLRQVRAVLDLRAE